MSFQTEIFGGFLIPNIGEVPMRQCRGHGMGQWEAPCEDWGAAMAGGSEGPEATDKAMNELGTRR